MSQKRFFPPSRPFLLSALLLAAAALLSASALAQTESVVYSFQGGIGDGANPDSGLVADSSGHFFGTAAGGVTNGTVYELIPQPGGTWNEVTIHSFAGFDGSGPAARLLRDSRGNLYGTTSGGGNYGRGVVFEMKPGPSGTWDFLVLHNFNFDGISNFDGWQSYSSLIMDRAGSLYGTTRLGGNGGCFSNRPASAPNQVPKGEIPSGCGTVFKLTPHLDGSWSEKILYNFQGGPDGGLPFAGLTRDTKGAFYGTTWNGGSGPASICASSYDNGCGVVFSLSLVSGAWVERPLYAFQAQNDGANPTAPLVFDHAGNLYGTTNGTNLGDNSQSTVFQLSPASNGTWTEKTLYNFDAGGNGYSPQGGVVLDAAGNLYGTTFYGDAGTPHTPPPPKPIGVGIVFKLTPAQDGTWTESVLHSFASDPDGAFPGLGNLLLYRGSLIGTTTQGGSANAGTVFKVTP